MKIRTGSIEESPVLILKKRSGKFMKKKKSNERHGHEFSSVVRGKFFRLAKSQRMIPLDADIVAYFQKRGPKKKKAYYVLINETLRRTMNYEKPAAGIAELLQEMIAEEVQKHAVRR
jgi:uncharacterized protein (DUF4415 family)